MNQYKYANEYVNSVVFEKNSSAITRIFLVIKNNAVGERNLIYVMHKFTDHQSKKLKLMAMTFEYIKKPISHNFPPFNCKIMFDHCSLNKICGEMRCGN